MITHLIVEHYKSISYANFNLGNIVLLVGKNSSGKSNIVDALHFLQESFRNGLDFAVSQRYGIKSVRQWSPTKPYRIRISVEVTTRTGAGHFALKLDSFGDRFVIFEEEGSWNTYQRVNRQRPVTAEPTISSTFYYKRNNKAAVEYRLTPKREFLFQNARLGLSETDLAISIISTLPVDQARGIRELWRAINNIEAYSIYPNTIRAPQKPSTLSQLSRHGENISTIIKRMQISKARQRNYNELNSLLRLVIPNLEVINVESIGGLLAPRFDMKSAGGKKHFFNVSQVSDGSLRVLGLLTALFQLSTPDTIALEEPEQNINPGVLGIIADAAKDIAKRKQVIITTHSPHLVDYFDVDDVRSVFFRDNSTHVASVAASQMEAVKSGLFSLGELMITEGLLQK